MRRIRFSLRWWLNAVVLLSASIGLGVRAWLAADQRYDTRSTTIGGYGATASWNVNGLGEEELVYLIVFAQGDAASSRFNGISRGPKLPLSLKSDYDAQVLGLYPQALYINQDKVRDSDGGNVWVFSTVQQRPLLIGKHEVSRLGFTQLEGTPLWTAVIKPRVDAESAAWEQLRQERIRQLIQEHDHRRRSKAKAFSVPGYE